jgi:hypothetical protein
VGTEWVPEFHSYVQILRVAARIRAQDCIMTAGEQTAKAIGWPDTTVDRTAWEQAKAELGADADIHALIDRANKLKAIAKEEL